MNKGLLIVIDGIDGSGKTTQLELLKQTLTCETISFPRYEDNEYGKLVKRYLEGEFGNINEVNPYLMALAYAGDRALAKPLIEKWLEEGKVVLANRYVSSNKAYMGVNLSEEKRADFFKWLDVLEYETNKIPKENLLILLTVDPEIGQKNVLGRHPDIHEASLKHLEEANKIYLELSKLESNWIVVNCMENGQMRSKENIHKEIMQILSKVF